ncbi:MAG: 3-dehydroquinate synthase [Bacteroidia bacterium]|nr:3-dehydroquinate synthase [Bacteroidia bacterium]
MIRRALGTYNIDIGPIETLLASYLHDKDYSQIVLIDDEHTEALCRPKLDLDPSLVITIQPGEQHKSIDTCSIIWRQLIEAQIDRHALVINLGGGVIGDMGGFCASTFKRGIDFIQIPTTLLSQVDASVGGKLGVDLNGIKNIVGLFKDPGAVLIDPGFLETLPVAELRSGYAEIVKHGLIADAQLWKETKTYDLSNINWEDIINRSVAVKQKVVEQDPFERNLRKILNFGHTIGHAVETYYLNGPNHLLHGEAIAIGMICESYLSSRMTTLPESVADEIKSDLLAIYERNDLPDLSVDQLMNLMSNDKKNKSGNINFSLIDRIGSCMWDQVCSLDMIKSSFEFYLAK